MSINMMLPTCAFLLFGLVWFVPLYRIFRRAHFHAACALFAIIPLLGPLVCLWVLCIRPWPLKAKLVRVFA